MISGFRQEAAVYDLCDVVKKVMSLVLEQETDGQTDSLPSDLQEKGFAVLCFFYFYLQLVCVCVFLCNFTVNSYYLQNNLPLMCHSYIFIPTGIWPVDQPFPLKAQRFVSHKEKISIICAKIIQLIHV